MRKPIYLNIKATKISYSDSKPVVPLGLIVCMLVRHFYFIQC